MVDKKKIVKVTDPEVIKTGERDLMDTLKDDLDWDAVKAVIAHKVDQTNFTPTGGKIVVHGGDIAFKIDLEVRTTLSLLFDRRGNFIETEDLDLQHPVNHEEEVSTPLESFSNGIDEMDGAKIDQNEMEEDFDAVLSLSDDAFEGSDGDEEIDALLKESREFWENKKG